MIFPMMPPVPVTSPPDFHGRQAYVSQVMWNQIHQWTPQTTWKLQAPVSKLLKEGEPFELDSTD